MGLEFGVWHSFTRHSLRWRPVSQNKLPWAESRSWRALIEIEIGYHHFAFFSWISDNHNPYWFMIPRLIKSEVALSLISMVNKFGPLYSTLNMTMWQKSRSSSDSFLNIIVWYKTRLELFYFRKHFPYSAYLCEKTSVLCQKTMSVLHNE